MHKGGNNARQKVQEVNMRYKEKSEAEEACKKGK